MFYTTQSVQRTFLYQNLKTHISNLKIACSKFSSKTTKWSLMGGLTVCNNCCLKETSVYNALDFLLLSGQTGDGKTHLNEKFGY